MSRRPETLLFALHVCARGAIVAIPLLVASFVVAALPTAALADCGEALADLPKASTALDPLSDEAREAAFADEQGQARRLADFIGRGVVLNFWATWCAPCVKEMPELDRLAGRVASMGVDVLAISEDRGGATQARQFYDANGIIHLPISMDVNQRLVRAFGARGLPTTYLIDPSGRLVARVEGAIAWDADEAVEAVRACLASEQTPAQKGAG
ncbi:MAG: TlpA disulfide reductase family protein [Rhodospirillales bacterium]